MPWVWMIVLVRWRVEGRSVDCEGEGETWVWARHFSSSVGVLIIQVANPPTAPAIQTFHKLLPGPATEDSFEKPGGWFGPNRLCWFRNEEVRL